MSEIEKRRRAYELAVVEHFRSSEIEKRRRLYELEDRVSDVQPSEVEKLKLLYETEEKLLGRFKHRFWIILILGSLGVVGAIYALVERTVNQVATGPLKEIEKKLTESNLLSEKAKAAATTAAGSADQVNAQLSLRQKDVEDLQEKAKVVEKQFGVVMDRINAEARNAATRSTQDFKAAQERISNLEGLVKKIGDENEATRKATADYAKKVALLEGQIEKNQKRFAENSKYTVWISFVPEQKALAQQVQNVLANVGFKASVRESSTVGKGNSLVYWSQEETKARDILDLVKPIIKDVQPTRLADMETKTDIWKWRPPDKQTKTGLPGYFSFLDDVVGGGYRSAFLLQLGS
jgi:hypothetical protein